MPINFYDEFNRDPADDQEYRDMTIGLNSACLVAVVILFFCVLFTGL